MRRAVNACTIIARNYLPHARVLAESFREHHPGGTFTVLVVDDTDAEDRSGEPFAVLSPYDIGIERAEVHRMAFIYDVKELATAVKPWLLEHLLARADHAIYFDPDIEIFAPLDDIATLARETLDRPHSAHDAATAARPAAPERGDAASRRDLQPRLHRGRHSARRPSSTWWQERLARNCIVDVEQGIFVDQRWIDFVPALFEHTVLCDTAYNVAYWNLTTRHVEWTGAGYEVNGAPLRFFHYSGFSPGTMELSTHMGDVPRILLEDHP